MAQKGERLLTFVFTASHGKLSFTCVSACTSTCASAHLSRAASVPSAKANRFFYPGDVGSFWPPYTGGKMLGDRLCLALPVQARSILPVLAAFGEQPSISLNAGEKRGLRWDFRTAVRGDRSYPLLLPAP